MEFISENTLMTLRQRLSDFEEDKYKSNLVWGQESERYAIDREDIPVPALLYFILRVIKEFSLGFKGEKTHWVIPFLYKGKRCNIALEKFGLRLYIEKQSNSINPREIVGKIKRSIIYAEKHILEPYAKRQIRKGNVTISNHFHQLDGMYAYFRKRAKESYDLGKNKEKRGCVIESLSKIFKVSLRSNIEGFYNALSMIDSFFSRLEHFLVISLAFRSFAPASDNLAEFIGLSWGNKYKRIFPLTDAGAKRFYDQLDNIKERFRNTFAHGAFEKGGAPLCFQIPKIGAIPANMSGYRDSPHFSFIPLEESHFFDVCQLFDNFDKWISEMTAPHIWKYANSGLDILFDSKSLKELNDACESENKFDEWIEDMSYIADIYENADH